MQHSDNAIEVLTLDFLCWKWTEAYLKTALRRSDPRMANTNPGKGENTMFFKDKPVEMDYHPMYSQTVVTEWLIKKLAEFEACGAPINNKDLIEAIWHEVKDGVGDSQAPYWIRTIATVVELRSGGQYAKH